MRADYDTLRQAGIAHITALARHTWTDHNPSDAGMVLLEQLCYALSDLGYRAGFPMPDLLAEGGEAAYALLFSPREILSTAALSLEDYRKLLIDLPGAKNAAVATVARPRPALYHAPFSGELLLEGQLDPLIPPELYREVRLKGLLEAQLAPWYHADGSLVQPGLAQEAAAALQAQRSLCSDFERIHIPEAQRVQVRVEIELGAALRTDALQAEIWRILDEYISPGLHFETLAEFAKGRAIEDIFDGPALSSGFLSREALRRRERRFDLRHSDLYREIMRLAPAIKAVRRIVFNLGETIQPGNDGAWQDQSRWQIELDPQRLPVFDAQHSVAIFYRDGERLPLASASPPPPALPGQVVARALDYPAPQGRFRDAGRYISVREHLPELLGVSPAGLPAHAGVGYRASARQLSAYLVFFEQVLANYFAQLSNAWRLLSSERSDARTWFAQVLPEDLPVMSGIFRRADRASLQAMLEAAGESPEQAEARSNRFLDHLLARFAETFDHYGALLLGLPPGQASREARSAQLIEDKRAFLRRYPELSAERGKAFDYTGAGWDTANVAGLKKRMAGLFGIRDFRRRDIGGSTGEGFFLLEHILLRPRPGDSFQQAPLLAFAAAPDPYSLRLSVAAPNFPFAGGAENRLNDSAFRALFEQTFRAETPTHIQLSFYWLDAAQLAAFSEAYRSFLHELRLAASAEGEELSGEAAHQFPLRVARDYLLDLLYLYSAGGQMPPGIPYPLTDLPLPREVAAESSNSGGWAADIPIPYAQRGVTYVLCDRQRRPVSPLISASGDDAVLDAAGRPSISLRTPGHPEARTYWIQARKSLDGHALPYVYLQQPVRVRVGIVAIGVSADPPEIEFGAQVNIRLANTQAGVEYRLVFAADGSPVPGTGTVGGAAGLVVDFPPSNVSGGLRDDTAFEVQGSINGFTSFEVVGTLTVRVRANPNLQLQVSPDTAAYGGSTVVEVISDPLAGNLTQRVATYTLYYRDIIHREFVHRRATPPPAAEVIHPFGAAMVQRPLMAEMGLPGPGFTLAGEQRISSDGDTVRFDLGSLSFREDALFVVIASKAGHDQPVLLGSGGLAAIGPLLVYPDTNRTAAVVPNPISAGERGMVQIADPQPGVRYFLRINGIDQEGVYFPDFDSGSSGRDGVGLSAVGVDFVVGPPPGLPLEIGTDAPLTGDTSAEVIGEKVQTGLQAVLGTLIIEVV